MSPRTAPLSLLEHAHARTADEVLSALDSCPAGLSADEAARRLAEVGPNRLPEPPRDGLLKRFFKHFNDVLIYVLLGAAAITASLGHWIDTGVILGVVVINAIIGFIQEGKAEEALAGIRKMLSLRADACRDGQWSAVDADGLVPGDVVRLRSGARVPADLRLIEATNLRIEESALTGELISKHPLIFRGLLDLCAQTLEVEQDAKVLYPARLMNFSRWLAALEQVLGMPTGRLQMAYVDTLRDAALETVRENTLAVTLLNFVSRASAKRWAGTATQLLEALSQIAPQQIVHRHAEWPQSPISLSKRLKQLSPLLQSQGIDIDFSHGTQRQVQITYLPPESGKTIDGIEELDECADDRVQPTGLADCSPIQDQGGIE